MSQNNKLKPVFSSTEEEEDDDEETSGSETDEVSDTDSGQKQTPAPKKTLISPPPQSAVKSKAPDLSSSESEHSGSDSDSDSPPAKSKQPQQTPTKVTQKTVNIKVKDPVPEASQSVNKSKVPDLASSEEEESCSETESGSESDSPAKKPIVADVNVKPLASKPMERGRIVESELVKKDVSKGILTPSKRPLTSLNANEKDPKKVKKAPDVSDSEEKESGSDSDSDTDLQLKRSAVVVANVKPTASKAMETEGLKLESKLAKKEGLKFKTAITPKNRQQALAKKRLVRDDDSKKQLFQRLWSEDDEIAILKGMIDYKTEKNGENPIMDMGAFHEFIKKSLHVDVTRAQLVDKVRRLKKKYVNNAEKEKDGKERSFSKSHEQKGYELSKLIWGCCSESNGTNVTKSKRNQSQNNGNSKGAATSLVKSHGVDDDKTSMMEVDKNDDKNVATNIDVSRFVQFGGMNGSLIMPEEILKAGMEVVDGSKRAELEEKWKKLKKQELVLYVERLELLREQALVVLEAINSSGN